MDCSRRRFLRTGALAVGSGVLAGCAGTADTTPSTETRVFRSRRERGAADAISVSEAFDDRYAYLDASDAVRRNGTDADPMPFRRWARLQCLTLGAGRVRERIVSRTETGLMLVHGPPEESLELTVRVMPMVEHDGTTDATPGAAFESIVTAAPRSVTATVSLQARTSTETIPVWVEATA
jgi:hypothetical protein